MSCKCFTYIFLLITLQNISYSQSTMFIDWGQEYKCKGNPTYEARLIESDENFYYLLDHNFYIIPGKNVTRYKVLKFDHENRVVDDYDANLRFGKRRLSVSKLIGTKDGVYAIAPFYDFSDKYKLMVSKFQKGKFQELKSKYEHSFKVNREPLKK